MSNPTKPPDPFKKPFAGGKTDEEKEEERKEAAKDAEAKRLGSPNANTSADRLKGQLEGNPPHPTPRDHPESFRAGPHSAPDRNAQNRGNPANPNMPSDANWSGGTGPRHPPNANPNAIPGGNAATVAQNLDPVRPENIGKRYDAEGRHLDPNGRRLDVPPRLDLNELHPGWTQTPAEEAEANDANQTREARARAEDLRPLTPSETAALTDDERKRRDAAARAAGTTPLTEEERKARDAQLLSEATK